MVVTPFALLLVLAQRSSDQYTLSALGKTFVVRNGAKKETIPFVSPTPQGRTYLSFRRDTRWAVWDARGLTTRDGDWSATERLEVVATSPRAQERDAIRDTLAKVKAGKRTLAASGLSGARRIGGVAYFLLRWDEKDGDPWLEALLAVDLTKEHPKPRLVGTFPGLSLGRGLVDDRLGIVNGKVAVAVNGQEAWGVATFDPKDGTFGFDERGKKVVALDGDRIVEATTYGTFVAGHQEDGRTVPWMELHGPAEFVPGEGDVFLRTGSRLHNAETGAEFRLPGNAAIRRTPAGLLVFWPEKAPRSARLLDPSRLEERARWEKGTKKG